MSQLVGSAYYAVIPAEVRYDMSLKPNAKLLYGELTALCNQTGYCWATNEYFAHLYDLSVGTISRLVSQLEQKGYIRCEMISTTKGSQRRIYAGAFMVNKGGLDEIGNTPKGLDENAQTGLDKKSKRGLDEIGKQNNTSKNNKNIIPYLRELRDVICRLKVPDDDRPVMMAVMSALEGRGYSCQNEVPVPSRDEDRRYTGRIGLVAAKDGIVIAIEADRKSIRQKSLHKLRAFQCDARVVLLRNEYDEAPPTGIDMVISLKTESLDDLFHVFWDAYPKKVDKRRTYEVFKRLKVTSDLLSIMLQALNCQKQSRQWREANGQYIPHATTWLNGRRWEDAPPEAYSGPPDGAPSSRVVENEKVPSW